MMVMGTLAMLAYRMPQTPIVILLPIGSMYGIYANIWGILIGYNPMFFNLRVFFLPGNQTWQWKLPYKQRFRSLGTSSNGRF